jgi:heme exporter protein D
MEREDKPPLYKTHPVAVFSIALVSMFAFLIPAFFIFGFYDYFLRLENWRFIYFFVVVASFAAWVIALIFLIVHSINEVRACLKKYKRWKTRLKHINLGGVMFVLVCIAGITLFYFFMTAMPMYKDLNAGIEKKSVSA